MPGFSPVFGNGGPIYPAQQTYVGLVLTEDTTLNWPVEQQVGGANIAAAIVAVVADAGITITLSSAKLVSLGYSILFDNLGAETFTVADADGNTILTVASGEAWVLYLRNNSTDAGVWRQFQQGAGVSTANAAALAGAGLVAISTTLNTTMEVVEHAIDYSLISQDLATVQVWTGGLGTFTLPDPSTVGANWFAWIKNAGSGSLTLQPTSGTIDDSTSALLASLDSCAIVSDGSVYYTIGLGQQTTSVFDFISIDVGGSGNYTLTGPQLNRVAYEFTGVLTGDRNIIVPSTIQQYWVTNSTTGAFNLTVKTAAGTGVIVAPGTRVVLYCDGTNVVNANDSSSLSLPILINQGGTGATTVTAARTNLGATAVGSTLFTAANATAALAAIATAGTGVTITGVTIATDTGGNLPGYLDIPQNLQAAPYTLALADRGKHIGMQTASGTYTIPPNSVVAFPIGSAISFANLSGGNVTLARGAGVALLYADVTDANRTLLPYALATILKVNTNSWIISGSGVV